MKTTQKVIDNLKNKIAERKTQVSDLYSEYYYKIAINKTVDEIVGPKQEYLNVNNLPYVGY